MIEIEVAKAESLPGEEIEDVSIKICKPLTRYTSMLQQSDYYDIQAQQIIEGLESGLCRAVMDRLLIKLLDKKKSMLVRRCS